MLPHKITDELFGSFRAASAGKKIILLYPRAHYRNVFLSYLLTDFGEGLLYYRIPEQCKNLAGWLSGLLEEIPLIAEGFGARLAGALPAGAPADLGEALAADIAALNLERAVLYLDELDRVPHDQDFCHFIAALVDNLPDNAQIAVNARFLNSAPWISWVNQDDVAILGTAHRSSDLLLTKGNGTKPQLEIYAFGSGHAVSNGQEINNWDGRLPRNLFFYLIDNPEVTRDQIFEIFWSQLPIKEATNVFRVTKRKITECISLPVGDGKNYELTTYSTGYYKPSAKLVRHYDVADFEQAIEAARLSQDPAEQESLYCRAIDIYQGPFLDTIDLPWVETRRQQLQEIYIGALVGMASLKCDQRKWEEALGFYARALREDPQREDLHRGAMQMYINLGRTADAQQQYTLLERLLKQDLGVKPSLETQAMLELLG